MLSKVLTLDSTTRSKLIHQFHCILTKVPYLNIFKQEYEIPEYKINEVLLWLFLQQKIIVRNQIIFGSSTPIFFTLLADLKLWLKSNATASGKSSETVTESGVSDPMTPLAYIYKTLYYTDWLESVSSLDMNFSGEATMLDWFWLSLYLVLFFQCVVASG